MPNLTESLQGRDLGHLRIIAELWGVELGEQDTHVALLRLILSILSASRVGGLVNELNPNEKEALTDLIRHAGRLPWAQFTRIYGEVREMGVAKRDREQPYKQPVSAVEALWYRGMIAKAFFDSPAGPEEFAYIPEDLLVQIPLATDLNTPRMGRQASTMEYARVYLANDRVLDHACTLLGALRLGISLPGPFATPSGEELTPAILTSLLAESGLLDEAGMPVPEPVRALLEASRAEALAELGRSWVQSTLFNELRLL